MDPMAARPDFDGLRVNVAVVMNGPVRTLETLLRELESRPGIKVVFVRTSGGRLRVIEDEGRP
jgi:hypothetical protein